MRRTTLWLAAVLVACNTGEVGEGTPTPPALVECAMNADCTASFGSLAICRKSDKRCVDLLTPECPRVFGVDEPADLSVRIPEDAILVGALTPAFTSELGDAVERAIELAQREIASATTSPRRPIVVLECREYNPDGHSGLTRAARHLVDDVEVPIIVGPEDNGHAFVTGAEVTGKANVLTILPTAITPRLSEPTSPSSAPIWRLNYDVDDTLPVLQHLIDAELVPKLKADGVLAAGEPLRVAIISEDDWKGREVARVLREGLRWNRNANGEPMRCAENLLLDPPACQDLTFGSLTDTEGNPNPSAYINQVVEQTFDNGGSEKRAHLILHAYSFYGIPRVLFPIEAAWDQSTNATSQPRPYHVGLFPAFNAFQPLDAFISFQEREAHPGPAPYKPLSQRMFAVYPHPTEDQGHVDDFVFTFKEAFPEFAASSTPGDTVPRLFYDAMYLAAYAIAANGQRPVTGTNLNEMLPRFVRGEPLRVGRQQLSSAFSRLEAGESIDVQGVSGHLDLDTGAAGPRYSMELSCPGVRSATPADAIGKGGPYDRFTHSGVYFDEVSGTVVGRLPGTCPTLANAIPADVWPGL